jgi:magnesium-transporting ATPase (P-type)
MVQVPTVEPLSAENMLWANTVLAAGSAIGFVVYTGPETRAVMNTSHPKTKVGLLDLEISQLAKVRLPQRSWGLAGDDDANGDFMCRFFRVVRRTRSIEWVPWTLVHLCVPILDSFLVNHSYQVRSFDR